MLTELDQKIRNQENMFYKLPLCNLPTLKRIVEDVGFDDIDMLEGIINHSKKAIEEAIDSNLDDKEEGCEHVWTFILRMYRLLKRINHEARLAAGLEDDDAIHIHIPAEPGEDGFEAALDATLEDAGVMSAEPNEDGKEECDMLTQSLKDLLLLGCRRSDTEVTYELGGTVSEETHKRFDEIISDGDGSIPKYSTITPIVWYKVVIPSWGVEQLIRSTPEFRILLLEKPDHSLWIWRPDHAKPISKIVLIDGTPVERIYYKMVKKGGAL